jgi:mono/diheme cytochrome c family protein
MRNNVRLKGETVSPFQRLRIRRRLISAGVLLGLCAGFYVSCAKVQPGGMEYSLESNMRKDALAAEGKQIFRYDTFGSEDFWGGKMRLHEAIAGEKLGGVGSGITPNQALALGLKVDMDAVPKALGALLVKGNKALDDPESTVALLKANAVVGVTGFFNKEGRMQSIGIQCALCHSTVDDSLLPGIGRRLDGWPNRDLDVGSIIASAPNLSPFTEMLQKDEATVKKVLTSWGPGKFDAQLNLDGKGFRPDGKTAATLNPPAFGLAGVNNHTWTGAWGTIPYWNAYVANLEMHGKGTFYDPRLDDAEKYPVAARTRQGHKKDDVDLITSKLSALHMYQLSLPTPTAPAGTFDAAAAKRGKVLFNTTAQCATCHVPPLFTEPGWNLHKAEDIGIDDFQAMRSPDGKYRTTPLRALWETKKVHKGGFYHDGRFATLLDVVNHYDGHLKLNMTEEQKRDLIEYLKSL